MPEISDDERAELVEYVLARGATADDVARTTNLGELALDLHLRARTDVTLAEVAERVGIDWPRAERLLVALGLPPDPGARTTADEAAALELLATVARDVIGEDTTAQIARVVGNAMARVADTVVTAFRLEVELPRQTEGARYIQVVREYAALIETMLPTFVRTLDALLRRQMIAVAERMWTTDDERTAVTLPRAIGFADLVGYSAAAATLSPRALIDVLVEFDERTSTAVARRRGQIVKTIGDEAMFVTEDPADACRIALDLVREFETGPLPPVRVGLARGEVVAVLGDVFGPDVNLAARLVGVAEPSTVVVSGSVAAGAGDAPDLVFEALPPVAVKGLAEPVVPYTVTFR